LANGRPCGGGERGMSFRDEVLEREQEVPDFGAFFTIVARAIRSGEAGGFTPSPSSVSQRDEDSEAAIDASVDAAIRTGREKAGLG